MLTAGCSSTPVKKGPVSPDASLSDMLEEKDREISELKGIISAKDGEIKRLNDEVESVKKQYRQTASAAEDMEKAKRELEKKLVNEINDYKAKLQITERGLVITFLSEILFDPGKDSIKEPGRKTLREVAEVLNKNMVSSNIAVEGHTDNQPIKYSGWRSNWELSCARALAVVHDLVDECGVKPDRLSAVGYGEFRPVFANTAPEGQGKNRRVEIIILPSNIKKVGK